MQNAESDADRGDHNKSEEGVVTLVIACLSTAKFLEAIKETLCYITPFIHLFIKWPRLLCVHFRRDRMLDTNICIYAMKNKPEHVLARLKKELNSGVCISSITLAELEYGMKHSSNPGKNEQALLRFLVPLSVLPFGTAAASEYGEIRAYLQRSGTPIGPLDILIAAHARSEDMILVTNNVCEFERVPDLEVENWVE